MKKNVNNTDRSIRRRVQVAASVIVGLVVIVGAFVLQPEYSRASEAHTEVGRLVRENSSIGATESMLRELVIERDNRLMIEESQLRQIPQGAGDAGLSDALALNVAARMRFSILCARFVFDCTAASLPMASSSGDPSCRWSITTRIRLPMVSPK